MRTHWSFKYNGRIFFRKYFVWFMTFSIASWLVYLIIDNITINFFLSMILAGFILESSSKMMQIFIFKNSWKINKYYIFWILIHSIIFYLSISLVNYFSNLINFNPLIYYFLVGLFITILVRIVWKFNLEKNILSRRNGTKKSFWIILIIILIIGFIWANNSGYIKLPNISSNQNIINKNGCPEGIIPTIISTKDYFEYDGTGLFWLDGTAMNKFKPDKFSHTPELCRKGEFEGENVDYFYCDNLIYSKIETDISEEGIIGKTTTTNYMINLEVIKINDLDGGCDDSWNDFTTCKNWIDYQVIRSLCFSIDEIPQSRDVLDEFFNWAEKEEVWKY